MISNPEMQAADPSQATSPLRWPRLFSHWQLLSLVPAVVHRLENTGRVLELEVGGQSLLASLARSYPTSQFIGLTSLERARKGLGGGESTARNLHFRAVELMELSRFRQVDLVLALGGLRNRSTIREAAATMTPGGFMVVREEEKAGAATVEEFSYGTRFMPSVARTWVQPPSLQHSLTMRALSESFASVHVVRLPEDPAYLYYVARMR